MTNTTHIYVGAPCPPDVIKLLKRHELILGRIMTKVNELAEKLNVINAQLHKASAEIIGQINALQDALTDVELPQEAIDAMNELESIAQALDDLNPDAPPPVEDPEDDESGITEPLPEEAQQP
jgi:archaellum component FlaC